MVPCHVRVVVEGQGNSLLRDVQHWPCRHHLRRGVQISISPPRGLDVPLTGVPSPAETVGGRRRGGVRGTGASRPEGGRPTRSPPSEATAQRARVQQLMPAPIASPTNKPATAPTSKELTQLQAGVDGQLNSVCAKGELATQCAITCTGASERAACHEAPIKAQADPRRADVGLPPETI